MASSASAIHLRKSGIQAKKTLSTARLEQRRRKVSASTQKRPVPHRQSPKTPEKLFRKTSLSVTSSEEEEEADDDELFSETEEEETYWHGTNCLSCEHLLSIDEKNMAQLQHQLKFAAIYSTFHRVMMALYTIIITSPNSNDYKKDSNIFDPKQAKDLCELSASSEIISKNQPELFKEAAKLSDELVGPTKSDKFNCDHYKRYLELLLEIAKLIVADEELIGDIETYLKPFRQEPISDGSIAMGESEPGNDPRKWQETFLDLKHSPEDKSFGYELKKIAEPRRNKESFELIPSSYVFKCHGLSTSANSIK
jgi:hypothetical protein